MFSLSYTSGQAFVDAAEERGGGTRRRGGGGVGGVGYMKEGTQITVTCKNRYRVTMKLFISEILCNVLRNAHVTPAIQSIVA